ncbi:MAG TPA: NUDIX hydrolase [Gemmatimonadaceae bacterium]|nr:NUDIX hydrolase [Gemmatimonadaceae bacterium]
MGGGRARAKQEISAGGVVFRLSTTGDGAAVPLFLLIRDSYRNWGFPKGHLEEGERPEEAAVREVAEETGVTPLELRGVIETIDWYFRFRGRLIHKVCHFYLMETPAAETCPQRAEGITACRWAPFAEAERLVSYANARQVLQRAHEMVTTGAGGGAYATLPNAAVPNAAMPNAMRVDGGATVADADRV